MDKLVMSAGPHIHSDASARRIMLDVILALLPAAIAAVVLFGLPALWIILTCVLSAVASEFLFNLIARRKQSVGDLSAVVTGLLLALNLSVNVPLWQCVIGSVFAIVLVKCASDAGDVNIIADLEIRLSLQMERNHSPVHAVGTITLRCIFLSDVS